jgi:hypothetical protein
MSKTDKRPKLMSPKGKFRYPKLNEPDLGTEKNKKKDPEYNLQLVLKADSPEAKKLIADLEPFYEEAKAKGAEGFKGLSLKTRKELEKEGVKGPKVAALYETIYDKETEEPTGEIAFRFKMKASGVNKKTGKPWTRTPVVFDAKGKRMVKLPTIWGGTIGKVQFEPYPYYAEGQNSCGLSFYFAGIQIIELVTAGGASAESMGFEEEEGYEYAEADAAPSKDFSDETGDDDDDTAGNF